MRALITGHFFRCCPISIMFLFSGSGGSHWTLILEIACAAVLLFIVRGLSTRVHAHHRALDSIRKSLDDITTKLEELSPKSVLRPVDFEDDNDDEILDRVMTPPRKVVAAQCADTDACSGPPVEAARSAVIVPAGIVPAGIVPAGILPAGILPDGIVPEGTMSTDDTSSSSRESVAIEDHKVATKDATANDSVATKDLKIGELRELCKERGLESRGSRADLLQRITNADLNPT